MKRRICPVCGHWESAGTEYCTECNAKTIEYDDGTGKPEIKQEKEPAEEEPAGQKGSGKAGSGSKGMPLGTIGIVAVLAIAALVFVNRNLRDSGEGSRPDPSDGSSPAQSDSRDDDPSGGATDVSLPEGDGGTEDGFGTNESSSWATATVIAPHGVKIRQEASSGSVMVGGVETGTVLKVISQEQGDDGLVWYQVQVDDTTTGYIRSDLVDVTGEVPSTGDEESQGGGEEEGNATEPPADGIAVEEGINSYELIVADVTWAQAYYDCLDRGGHLVRITTDAEYQAILEQISNEGKNNIIFWLGGARNEDSGYYWIYDDGYFGSEILNEDAKYASYWLAGEPSFHDEAAGVDETRMNMFRLSSSGQWVWNDVPDDILSVASFYSGKIGYICEYE